MREVFISCGWDIVDEFAEHGDEGIFHNFGFLAGKYDKIKGVQFNYFGKLLRRIIDVKLMGHMLCYAAASLESLPSQKYRLPPQFWLYVAHYYPLKLILLR